MSADNHWHSFRVGQPGAPEFVTTLGCGVADAATHELVAAEGRPLGAVAIHAFNPATSDEDDPTVHVFLMPWQLMAQLHASLVVWRDALPLERREGYDGLVAHMVPVLAAQMHDAQRDLGMTGEGR